MNWKDIKKMVIVEDESEGQNNVPQVKPLGQSAQPGIGTTPNAVSTGQSAFLPSAPSTYVTPAFGIVGSINQKVVDYLVGELDKKNLPGIDYYEFKKALDANKAINVPENVLYQMTFGTMVTMQSDVTPDLLLSTGNQYLGFLKNELDAFTTDSNGRKDKEIGGRQANIDALKADSDAKAAQIAELSKGIQANADQINTLNGEITTESANLQQREKDFEVTYQSICNAIQDNLNKISLYLKPNTPAS